MSKRYNHIDFPLTQKKAAVFYERIQNEQVVKQHRFLPFIRFTVDFDKYNRHNGIQKKERPISLVAHKDAGIYTLYADKLNEHYNAFSIAAEFSQNAVAYRNADEFKGVSNITTAKEVFDFIDVNKNGYVIKGDFKGFFDNLDHEILNNNIKTVLNYSGLEITSDWQRVLTNLEKFTFIEKNLLEQEMSLQNLEFPVRKRKNEAYFSNLKSFGNFIKSNKSLLNKNSQFGIPQGTSLSAVLANVYMIEFDDLISNKVKSMGGIYKRYSDDFIIVIPELKIRDEVFEDFVKCVIKSSQNLLKLQIEKNKTNLLKFHEGNFVNWKTGGKTGLDYLGFVFSDNTVSVRPKSIYKFDYRARIAIKAAELSLHSWKLLKEHPDWSAEKLGLYNIPAKEWNRIYISLSKNESVKRYGGLSKKSWNLLKSHPDWSDNKLGLIGVSRAYLENIYQIKVSINRAKRVKYHVDRDSTLNEVNTAFKRYMVDSEFVKDRESYISYARKASNIFDTGNSGYKNSILKQMNRQRAKSQRLKHDMRKYLEENR